MIVKNSHDKLLQVSPIPDGPTGVVVSVVHIAVSFQSSVCSPECKDSIS